MTRERLLKLSPEDLKKLAAKAGLKLPDETDREVIIDEIIEAMEEDRLEKELTNNPAMRVKKKKFDIVLDEEIAVSEEGEIVLPENYNDTSIILMLRDPQWAYTYWDISRQDREKLDETTQINGMFLRVFNATTEEDFKKTDYFDIPVKTDDTNWYINLPKTGNHYKVQLLVLVGEDEKILCTSNTVYSPVADVAPHGGEFGIMPDILILSGLNQSGTGNEEIPQRIISLMDTQYLRTKN